MKLPISWLKDYVKTDVAPEQIAQKLIDAGFEVEQIINYGKDIKNVVVGKILSIVKHPNADKLQICAVNTGKNTLEIVTGAKNVKTGDIVPVALDGATLPAGKSIFKGELRGVMSYGMLCGGSELGIGEIDYAGASVDGILILKDDCACRLGADIKDVLGLNEYILDVSVTANRPDCQSIIGLCREVASALKIKFTPPDISYKVKPVGGSGDRSGKGDGSGGGYGAANDKANNKSGGGASKSGGANGIKSGVGATNSDGAATDKSDVISDFISVKIDAPQLCPRYMGAVVKDVKIEDSPKWLKDRLKWAGVKSISNIVDITNFILLEYGQPMHAYDLNNIQNKKITVRKNFEGESITLLDGKKLTLKGDVLLIADGARAVGLAGIMGGQNSQITLNTKNIMFESASFNRENIRHSSKKLGVRSEASARFEKGTDLSTCEYALQRALHLIQKLNCGTVVGGVIDKKNKKIAAKTIKLKVADVKKLLGIEIPKDTMIEILNNLQIKTQASGTGLVCVIPYFRDDLQLPCDLIEEIIRVYGYAHIKPTLLKDASVTMGGLNADQTALQKTKNALVSMGLYEAVSLSFSGQKTVEKLKLDFSKEKQKMVPLLNPLGEDVGYLRATNIGNMLSILSLNDSRKNEDAGFFEIATVFNLKNGIERQPDEKRTLTLSSIGESESFYRLKDVIKTLAQIFKIELGFKKCSLPFLHPNISAAVFINDVDIGFLGRVHPDVQANFDINKPCFISELNFDIFCGAINQKTSFEPLAKYPSVGRDIAIVIKDDIEIGGIIECIRQNGAPLLKDVKLFDIYKGDQIKEGKSAAFTLTFVSHERTLRLEEVDVAVSKILSALTATFGAKLRQ
jgi:phenylalanyl-tRNA synthetase beta chain